jgi:hypothetical protein
MTLAICRTVRLQHLVYSPRVAPPAALHPIHSGRALGQFRVLP